MYVKVSVAEEFSGQTDTSEAVYLYVYVYTYIERCTDEIQRHSHTWITSMQSQTLWRLQATWLTFFRVSLASIN